MLGMEGSVPPGEVSQARRFCSACSRGRVVGADTYIEMHIC